MRDKGQFSIIASLLVAIILVSTVILTYSTIRNFPVGEQSQVLNAIDETNFALKQILGFTVGYYGSILQVTGDREYAYSSALKYWISGLNYISRMHPDWALSFNSHNVDLETYWFTSQSYSKGKITVEYDLTGLGIYGISYTTSCKLTVNVSDTNGNKARITVTVDEKNEPLINLGKSNFRFYLYRYTNSTWALTNPKSEPSVFSNGTYLIDIPQGIDPNSYLVQVEDSRGIVTIASSFSKYTCTFDWEVKLIETKYAVVASHSQIKGKPDGVYATVNQASCEVTAYQGGLGTIKQVYFNISYYYPQSGQADLTWYYRLDGGDWKIIGSLAAGGTAQSPLTVTFNATGLRASWTWDNLNATSIKFANSKNKDAYVDAIYVTLLVDKQVYSSLQDGTVVVELLQNGTVRWLGQNLSSKTEAKPIPPLPVKSIHVNQTINGIEREVPFQIEDWASGYKVPLGLVNNASVFNNRNMIVFLANKNVSKVTIWWDGRDTTNQTSLAYKNRYFTFSSAANSITLETDRLLLSVEWSSGNLRAISTAGSVTSTAVLMRINKKVARWGSSAPAVPINNGPVRTILHHEVEWGSSTSYQIPDCPNVYAHIVLTLPANATYYTYQLRLTFVESGKDRTITDLCPISLSFSGGQPKTENGTANGYPIISGSNGLFYNFSATCWQHHWSQLNSSLTKGTGIMFTDAANKMLYRFDTIVGTATGALNVTSSAIELCPVTGKASASFKYHLDLTWYGAIVTFDGTNPILKPSGSGLWVLVEYPPAVTVTTQR